jgi:hypothetical protein
LSVSNAMSASNAPVLSNAVEIVIVSRQCQ